MGTDYRPVCVPDTFPLDLALSPATPAAALPQARVPGSPTRAGDERFAPDFRRRRCRLLDAHLLWSKYRQAIPATSIVTDLMQAAIPTWNAARPSPILYRALPATVLHTESCCRRTHSPTRQTVESTMRRDHPDQHANTHARPHVVNARNLSRLALSDGPDIKHQSNILNRNEVDPLDSKLSGGVTLWHCDLSNPNISKKQARDLYGAITVRPAGILTWLRNHW